MPHFAHQKLTHHKRGRSHSRSRSRSRSLAYAHAHDESQHHKSRFLSPAAIPSAAARTAVTSEPRHWPAFPPERSHSDDEDEGFAEGEEEGAPAAARGQGQGQDRMPRNLDFLRKDAPQDRLPPQTVLMRVVRELEDDFSHYKGIYTELADQYKLMDPASNVVKRNVLAEHLREVIDVLEQKGDQIASLYDLLSFEDKPAAQSVVPDRAPGPSTAGKRALKRHTTLA
ncbi:hypothetical protein EWM64_g5546 [Hericium alpestre]|uniref:Cep57 centrosome microtubule-binding domain-containing protein n=1 Tax=Hericium alpestre TaxID=135208 RepID=A0A4Y9ZUB5_9AGAM|nr:hypothetical protein EWM64_g5546 [Hericium alpestre]